MRRIVGLVCALAFLAAACGGSEPSGAESAGGQDVSAETPRPTVVAPTVEARPVGFLRCEPDAAFPAAPDEWYRDTPRYVGNEQPTEQVRAWAMLQPGFQEVWIDRDRNGWVTAAFDRPVDDVQAELESEFPGDGVVAVQVDWNLAELRGLQRRVAEVISDVGIPAGIGVSMRQGVVDVSFGVLSDEALATLAAFEGEPICVSGRDPEGARTGPQADSGDGWRLLAIDGSARRDRVADGDEPLGPPPTPGGIVLGTRVELATNAAQYDASWNAAVAAIDGGLTEATPRPDVDFEREIAVFGTTVESGSCAQLVFGITVEPGIVAVDVAESDAEAMCNSDANPLTWVVAIERAELPEPPFVLQGPDFLGLAQLQVTDDLRAPGSTVDDSLTIGIVATAGSAGGPPTAVPQPTGFEPDARPVAPTVSIAPAPAPAAFPHVAEPGFASTLEVPRACFPRLGPINGFVWKPVDDALAAGDVPDDWLMLESGDTIPAELLLTNDPGGEPTLDVTVGIRTERYLITDDPTSC